MKNLTVLLSVICLSVTSPAKADIDDSPATTMADGYELSPQTVELVSKYKRTLAPDLPEPERWDELDSPYSAAPGRMRLVKNIVVKSHSVASVIHLSIIVEFLSIGIFFHQLILIDVILALVPQTIKYGT